MASTLFGIFEQSANFSIACPFKNGTMSFNQVTLPDVSVPPFIRVNETWQLISNLQFKEKKMLSIWITNIDFTLIEFD